MNKLIFATSNSGKVASLQRYLDSAGGRVEVVGQSLILLRFRLIRHLRLHGQRLQKPIVGLVAGWWLMIVS